MEIRGKQIKKMFLNIKFNPNLWQKQLDEKA